MLKRKITDTLKEWKETEPKKALFIIGARQVGKSTAVKEFGKKNYEVFLELDFIANPEYAKIFENTHSIEDILLGLSAVSPKPLLPHKTLILLDEVQECPAARTAMKYLVQDGRYDYIETGSLLGVKISQIQSYPVGFERLINMYPLDLEEFMWAMKVQPDVISYLKNCYETHTPVVPAVHQRIMDLFRYYIVIGGMPEVVQNFVTDRSIASAQRIQTQILNLYRLDITKYAVPSDRVKIRNLFDSVPAQLSEKSPRFYLTKVFPNARMNLYESSLAWLIESQEILACYGLNEPQVPLLLNKKSTLFRLFFCDTGLLCSLLGNTVPARLLQQDSTLNAGCLFENCFAGQLAANGFELFYFNSKNIGELDFVLQNGDYPDLIEIKSGSDFEKHPALTRVMNHPGWKFGRKIVFCQSPGKVKDQIEYLPWYFVIFYQKAKAADFPLEFNFESIEVPDFK